MAADPVEQPSQVPPSDITRRHREHRNADGTIRATSDVVYRGKERIITSIRYTGQGTTNAAGSGWRVYYVGNEPRILEEDKAGDGSNVIVRVYGNGLDDFEAFHRRAGGQLEPVTGAKLAEMKREQGQIEAGVNAIGAMIKNAVDTHTNVDEAMDSIKKTATELRKKLDENKAETGKK